jgi:hypothetical protein
VAAVAAAVIASAAQAALFFLFNPTVANPGDLVTVRTGGTPASFTPRQRTKPYQRPIRLYVVPNEIADEVHTRFDSRLHFVGSLVPDKKGRGVLTFTVPPLGTDDYAAAAWCPACARYSFGRAFFVLRVGEDTAFRYRPLMLIRVEMPDPTEACPVTIPRGGKPGPSSGSSPHWYGNGLVWTRLPLDGVYVPSRGNVGWPGDPDGSVATKLYWFARIGGTFTLEGERLDALAPRLVVHGVNRGQSEMWRGPTWATPVSFPTEGCWRLTARLEDVSLSFVMKVVSG